MKKWIVLLMVLCLLMGGALALASDAVELVPGPTVFQDESSATGYSVTFVYEDALDADAVKLNIGACYHKVGEKLGSGDETFYTPFEWEDGMIGVGYEGYLIDLEKEEDTNLWSVTLPLPTSYYQYNYKVEKDGEELTETDPANPWASNPNVPEDHDWYSTVYVPADFEKQPSAVDFSYYDEEAVESPGSLSYVTYTDLNGDDAPLGVYLPAGYDPDREEPYKVAYVSHGGGSYETNWYGCGGLNIQFDHFIQDGTVEPTVLVTMNNTTYEWDYDVIVTNLMEHILPYMEENYNVSAEPSGRAFFGISMGGMTTSNVLYRCPEDFAHFGIFSGGDSRVDFAQYDLEAIQKADIMLAAGCYDFGLIRDTSFTEEDGFTTVTLAKKYMENGISFNFVVTDGGHDWYAWPEMVRIFVEDHLWQ